jgi:UPF0755 protein
MKKRNLLLGSVLFLVLMVFGMTGSWVWLTQPVSPQDNTESRFVVPKGQSITAIGQNLAEENLIKHPLAFRLVVKLQNLSNKIQAGSFLLSPSMNLNEIALALTQGTEDVWITIPEGWRREEIAQSLTRQGFTEFDEDEFLSLTATQEGKLFPDTYLVPQQLTAVQLAQLLTNTFERKIENELATLVKNSSYSLDEALVLASIVEREGRGNDELAMIAGILYNRLEIGMPLQTDATLQYINGYNTLTQNWWNPPTSADKELESPYNTYLNANLPPAPIANPGLSAIKAALNPTKNDYLFYLHDNSGKIHYARDYETHLANVNKYLR